jgi:alpha-N-arabinofuranosidase
LFGCGIEWTENGNQIYDSRAGRNRPEVVAALRKLRLTTLRFPGGILADYYNWRDGIGPIANRPKRSNPMDGTIHANNFGTDEFIDLCKQLGTEPLITLNAGTGTLQSALDWQQYFRSKGTPVKYFEIGNEIYLAEPRQPATIPGNDSRIYKSAPNYASLYSQWARALRSADSGCSVGAIAGTYNTSKENQGWLSTLLANAGSQIDFIALHNAFAPLAPPSYPWTDESKRADAYRALYTSTGYSAEDTRQVSTKLSSINPPSLGRVAITEHFPLFGASGTQAQLMQILDQSRTVAAGLYTASLLHNLMRQKAWMANFNLAIHQWFGALLQDTTAGLVENPHFLVYSLLRDLASKSLLQTTVTGPSFSSPAVGVVATGTNTPVLDVIAAIGADGIWVSVINREIYNSSAASLDLNLTGYSPQASVRTLAGPVPNAIRGIPLSSSVVDRTSSIVISDSTWTGKSGDTYTFRPMSLTRFFWPKSAATAAVQRTNR